MQKTLREVGVGVGFLVSALALVGCSTHKPAIEQRAAVRSIDQTYDYMGKAMLEIEGVRSALDRAPEATDLRAWYSEFSSKVAEMQQAGARARDHWQDLKRDQNEYVIAWEEEISKTSSPEIKETMEQRRQRVTDQYTAITERAQQLRDAYQPFLEKLKELDRALALDLTPAGVKALEPAMQQTKQDADVVATRLNELGQDLDRLSGRMSDETARTASYKP